MWSPKLSLAPCEISMASSCSLALWFSFPYRILLLEFGLLFLTFFVLCSKFLPGSFSIFLPGFWFLAMDFLWSKLDFEIGMNF
jgi:hypothetical protein